MKSSSSELASTWFLSFNWPPVRHFRSLHEGMVHPHAAYRNQTYRVVYLCYTPEMRPSYRVFPHLGICRSRNKNADNEGKQGRREADVKTLPHHRVCQPEAQIRDNLTTLDVTKYLDQWLHRTHLNADDSIPSPAMSTNRSSRPYELPILH